MRWAFVSATYSVSPRMLMPAGSLNTGSSPFFAGPPRNDTTAPLVRSITFSLLL